ncbi:tail completion protein gp17 [Erythrobacter aureus]|uniref:tail completion protein gp17 n=1 Tax=Erythrobacter aureus TaxID=2182384 RepID=UPI003A90B561
METALRSALVDWLRADPILAGMVNAIEEEGPIAASPPHIAIAASASTDWSTKTGPGREIRLALELVDRGDEAAATGAIAARIEQRIATLAPQQSGLRVVVTRFLRSRAERRRRNLRAVLLEYRFLTIAG